MTKLFSTGILWMCILFSPLGLYAQNEGGWVSNVASKLDLSKQEVTDMLQSADKLVLTVQKNFKDIAAYSHITYEQKQDKIKNTLSLFRFRNSPIQESNKLCKIRTSGAETYLNALSNRSYKRGNKVNDVQLTWGKDAKVVRAKQLDENVYKIDVSVWQFYFKRVLQEKGYTLDIPQRTRHESKPDTKDWVDDDEIYDEPQGSPTEKEFKSERDIFNVLRLIDDPHVTYSDATKKTITILCIRKPDGTWNCKIEKIRAACAIDVDTYTRLYELAKEK